jgi:hypothetical protein
MKYFMLFLMVLVSGCASTKVRVENCKCVNNCLATLPSQGLECDVSDISESSPANYGRGRFQ